MRTILLTTFISFLLAVSCKDNIITKDPPEHNVIYENSFESDTDLEGWTNLQINMLDESTSQCGDRSLKMFGDCIQPTTSYILEFAESSEYRVSCWGKIITENQKGILVFRELGSNENNTLLTIEFDGLDWEFKTGEFEVEAGTNVSLELMIGGIISAGMNFDCIKIEKI